VGNLTVGGTGKTPLVIWLATRLHAEGKRVAILSRGYGRQQAWKNILVSDGTDVRADCQTAGDEPLVIAQQCPWAIVAVGKDRYQLGLWVLEQFSCDCFILDDGYQHLSLYRDMDLLIFDATDLQGLAKVLPAGRMREPLDAAQWADGYVLTRSECVASIRPVQDFLEKSLGKNLNPMVVKSVPKSLTHLSTGRREDITYFQQKPIVVFSGIGNPGAFLSSLVAAGFDVREERRFPDHYGYGKDDVAVIRQKMNESGVQLAVTTEKDAVKLRTWCTADDPIWVVNQELEIIAGEHAMQDLLRRHSIV
jgi:tetraacyldisaccharide 4'-kinase